MAFKAITVNTPAADPAHILAEDDAALYESLVGGDKVLNVGGKLAATTISNNKIRITDGVVIVGGHVGRIYKGDYEDLTIENGTSGQNRNDLIVARYLAGNSGGADSYGLAVIKGTPGSTATDPIYMQGNLYNGDPQRDFPLYRAKLEGLSIVAVEQLFEVGKTIGELEEEIETLNSKLQGLLADPEDIELDLNTSGFTSNSTWAQRAGREVKVYPYVVGVPVQGRTIATGLPKPQKQIVLRDSSFGIVVISTAGIMSISSAGTTSSSYFGIPVSYWAAE